MFYGFGSQGPPHAFYSGQQDTERQGGGTARPPCHLRQSGDLTGWKTWGSFFPLNSDEMESVSCSLNMPLVKIWFAIRPQHFLLSPGLPSLVSQVTSVVFGEGGLASKVVLASRSVSLIKCLSHADSSFLIYKYRSNTGHSLVLLEAGLRGLRMSAPGQACTNGSSCCCD